MRRNGYGLDLNMVTITSQPCPHYVLTKRAPWEEDKQEKEKRKKRKSRHQE